MEPPFNPLGDNPEGPIQPVNPADLQSVWKMLREVQAHNPGENIAISIEMYKRACSPEANIGAVWFRASLVGMLDMFGMLEPWIHDGVVADEVFKVAAVFPMKRISVGVPQEELPFDVQAFLAEIERENNQ